MQKVFIGIDISSATVDIHVKQTKQPAIQLANEVKALKAFFKPYNKENTIVAMENTGKYNWSLFEVLAKFKGQVFVINPLHLKKSMGMIRGKNDRIDAYRICSFIEKHHQEMKPWQPTTEVIRKIKVLICERTSRVKMKTGIKQRKKLAQPLGLNASLAQLSEELLKHLDRQIQLLEEQIQELIEQDQQLCEQAILLQSIPGVGKILCWMMIAKTEGFTTFTEPRKMACYCGVVPFDHQSGTSLKSKPRVSIYADKSMKTILHLSALRAVRLNNDLQQYYQRKVEEGKNKMSVLNAVRNKIIHRMFAVTRNQKPYVINLVLS